MATIDLYSGSHFRRSNLDLFFMDSGDPSGIDALTADEGGGPTLARASITAPGRQSVDGEQLLADAKVWFASPQLVGKLQGAYYMLAGLWPLVAPDHFMSFTGARAELWLAQMLGALMAAAGIVLWQGTQQRCINASVPLLGVLVAMGLLGAELNYVSEQTLARSYLMEGVAEFAFLIGWAAFSLRRPQAQATAAWTGNMGEVSASAWDLNASRGVAA